MAAVIQTIDGVVVNKFELDQSELTFGRLSSNHVQIDDQPVSNKHAQIACKSDEKSMLVYFLEDLCSTNGTYINERKIGKQQLHHKDVIRIGWNEFTFMNEAKEDIEATSEIKKSWV